MDLPDIEKKSFFARFKEHVRKEGSKDPGGRYFSILLEQVFLETPEALAKSLFPTCRTSRFRHARVQTDFQYKPERLADLAFLDTEDRVIGLVEVKEEDQLGPGTGDQTQDYLSYVRNNSTPQAPIYFAYVTKHLPSEKSNSALQKDGREPTYYSELYRDFSEYLKDPKQSQRSPVAQLFCKYLQEEGVVYRLLEPDDDNVLRLLLRQGFGLGGTTGFGRDISAERLMQVPAFLGTLLSNVQAMGVEFHNRFRDQLGNRFAPRFAFYPWWEIKKVSKRLENLNSHDEVDGLGSDLCDGGALYLWSVGRLKGQGNCYVWLGQAFELSRSDKALTKYLHAGVSIGSDEFEDRLKIDAFPDQGKAQKGVRRIIRNQIKEARKSANSPARKRLASLGKALEKH